VAGFASLAMVLAVSLSACGEPVATPEPIYLRVAGSTAMGPLVTDLATAYSERSPQVTLEVIALGNHYGLEALHAGEADLAMANWLPWEADEFNHQRQEPADPLARPAPANWRSTAIAHDGIAVIVHASNPIQGLGLLQLCDLYSGKILDWQTLGAASNPSLVQLLSREDGSGTRAAFESFVMDGQRVSTRAIVVPSSEAVVEYVGAHPEAIGYVSMSFVTPSLKLLPIEGEVPTPESVRRGSYPLSHDLWLITLDRPSPPVQAFLAFVQSAAGQQIVGRSHGRLR
jgi:phosphate transport system substrate-binding protein